MELYNDDCLTVLDELTRSKFDFSKCIFVSDPPFNINYHYNEYDDNKNEGDYFTWLKAIFGEYKQVIIHYPEQLYRHSYNIGHFPEKVISWVYNANTPRQHRDIAFFNIKPDLSKIEQPYKNANDKRIKKRIAEGKMARLYDWWNINQVKNVSSEKVCHPCQMPIKVMSNIIGILPQDYTIIDPFMGTGTTGIACKIHSRDFIGIEMNLNYYNIAKDRIENYVVQEKLNFA